MGTKVRAENLSPSFRVSRPHRGQDSTDSLVADTTGNWSPMKDSIRSRRAFLESVERGGRQKMKQGLLFRVLGQD
jgi:hypothetical protein